MLSRAKAIKGQKNENRTAKRRRTLEAKANARSEAAWLGAWLLRSGHADLLVRRTWIFVFCALVARGVESALRGVLFKVRSETRRDAFFRGEKALWAL